MYSSSNETNLAHGNPNIIRTKGGGLRQLGNKEKRIRQIIMDTIDKCPVIQESKHILQNLRNLYKYTTHSTVFPYAVVDPTLTNYKFDQQDTTTVESKIIDISEYLRVHYGAVVAPSIYGTDRVENGRELKQRTMLFPNKITVQFTKNRQLLGGLLDDTTSPNKSYKLYLIVLLAGSELVDTLHSNQITQVELTSSNDRDICEKSYSATLSFGYNIGLTTRLMLGMRGFGNLEVHAKYLLSIMGNDIKGLSFDANVSYSAYTNTSEKEVIYRIGECARWINELGKPVNIADLSRLPFMTIRELVYIKYLNRLAMQDVCKTVLDALLLDYDTRQILSTKGNGIYDYMMEILPPFYRSYTTKDIFNVELSYQIHKLNDKPKVSMSVHAFRSGGSLFYK